MVVGFNFNIMVFDGFVCNYKVDGVQVQVEMWEVELCEVQFQVLGDIVIIYVEVIIVLCSMVLVCSLLEVVQCLVDLVWCKYDIGVVDIVEMFNV